jgi:hypothetical protein
MGSVEDIRWAPRLPQHMIQRLYSEDAQGMRDEELIAEVGYRLRARCESFIGAVEATLGKAPCPRCGTVIVHASKDDEILVCPVCGWSLSWKEYFSTIQRKQLSGAEPILIVFRAFVTQFPGLRTTEEKMVAIDQLLHSFHLYFKNLDPTRSAAINLIEGNYHDVVEFLDRLTYGEYSTPGLRDRWLDWRATINFTAALWQDERLMRKPVDGEEKHES